MKQRIKEGLGKGARRCEDNGKEERKDECEEENGKERKCVFDRMKIVRWLQRGGKKGGKYRSLAKGKVWSILTRKERVCSVCKSIGGY